MSRLLPVLFAACLAAPALAQNERDQGVRHDVHRRHLNEIVFANASVDFDRPDAGSFKTRFRASEPIFGRAYVPHSIVNTPLPGGGYPLQLADIGYFVTIDGELVASDSKADNVAEPIPGALFTYSLSGSSLYEWTSWQLYFLPALDYEHLDHDLIYRPATAFARAVAALPPGEYEVAVSNRIRWEGRLGAPLATGTFTLVVEPGDAEGLATRFVRRMPEAQMEDRALERAMAQALPAGGFTYDVLDLAIVERDWRVHRNALGVIINRTINTYVAFRMPDRRCAIYEISFEQPYVGGSWGSTRQYGVGESFDTECGVL